MGGTCTGLLQLLRQLIVSLFSFSRLLLPFSSGESGEASAQAKGTAATDEMRQVITLIVFFGFPEANDPLSLPFSLSPLNAMTLAPDSHTHGPWILASVEREFLLLLTDGERQGD